MGVTSYEWGPRIQLEANKFWAYALLTSIVLSLWDLFITPPTPITGSKDVVSMRRPSTTELYVQLVVDGCDLLLPSSAVGWLSLSPVIIGVTMTVSSSLSGRQIWQRVVFVEDARSLQGLKDEKSKEGSRNDTAIDAVSCK